MLITSVGNEFLECELDSQWEIVKVLDVLSINADRVCKVTVNIVREGLTDEQLNDNLRRLQGAVAAKTAQGELPI